MHDEICWGDIGAHGLVMVYSPLIKRPREEKMFWITAARYSVHLIMVCYLLCSFCPRRRDPGSQRGIAAGPHSPAGHPDLQGIWWGGQKI